VDAPRWNSADERGKHPLLFVYWLSGSESSLDLLRRAGGLMRSLGEAGVRVVTITAAHGMSDEEIAATARDLKLDQTVLIDDGLAFADTLGIRSVPAMTFVDREGIVRVTGAVAPGHEVRPGLTFEDYLRSGLATGVWPTVGQVPQYDETMELIGTRYADFTLPDLRTDEPRTLSSMLSPDRPTLLVFWTFNSTNCRVILPEMAEWYDENGRSLVNLISVATAPDDAVKQKTLTFANEKGLAFPVLLAGEADVGPAWRIHTTPTMVLIDSNGTIRGTAVGPLADYQGLAAAVDSTEGAVPPFVRGAAEVLPPGI